MKNSLKATALVGILGASVLGANVQAEEVSDSKDIDVVSTSDAKSVSTLDAQISEAKSNVAKAEDAVSEAQSAVDENAKALSEAEAPIKEVEQEISDKQAEVKSVSESEKADEAELSSLGSAESVAQDIADAEQVLKESESDGGQSVSDAVVEVQNRITDLEKQKADLDSQSSLVEQQKAVDKLKAETESNIVSLSEQISSERVTLDNLRSELANTVDSVDSFTLSADWVSAMKGYSKALNEGDVTSAESYRVKLESLNKQEVESNIFKAKESDKSVSISLNDDRVRAYTVALINSIREQFGYSGYISTDKMQEIAKSVSDGYKSDNWDWSKSLASGHDTSALANVRKSSGIDFEEDNNTWHYKAPSQTNLASAKSLVYAGLKSLLLNGYEWLHADSILSDKDGYIGVDVLQTGDITQLNLEIARSSKNVGKDFGTVLSTKDSTVEAKRAELTASIAKEQVKFDNLASALTLEQAKLKSYTKEFISVSDYEAKLSSVTLALASARVELVQVLQDEANKKATAENLAKLKVSELRLKQERISFLTKSIADKKSQVDSLEKEISVLENHKLELLSSARALSGLRSDAERLNALLAVAKEKLVSEKAVLASLEAQKAEQEFVVNQVKTGQMSLDLEVPRYDFSLSSSDKKSLVDVDFNTAGKVSSEGVVYDGNSHAVDYKARTALDKAYSSLPEAGDSVSTAFGLGLVSLTLGSLLGLMKFKSKQKQ